MKTPAILCLASLLVAVSGQFPNLSPSFSFEGSLVRTFTSGTILDSFPRYNLAVDISRQLQKVDQLEDSDNTITISSGSDDANYRSESPFLSGRSRTCSRRFLRPSDYFPIDSNVWEDFADSVESPPGTFTHSTFFDTLTVVIENGVPVSYTIDSGTITTITFTSYSDEVPAHSVFSLPSECSSLDCNACYDSNPATNPPNPITFPPNPITFPPNPITFPPNPITFPPNPITFPPNPITFPPNPITFPPNQSNTNCNQPTQSNTNCNQPP